MKGKVRVGGGGGEHGERMGGRKKRGTGKEMEDKRVRVEVWGWREETGLKGDASPPDLTGQPGRSDTGGETGSLSLSPAPLL